jgi:ketosteroid isomerase-like protein
VVSAREAIESRSLDDFAEALADDVVWIGLWPGEICRNRDDVLEMFARMREREVQVHQQIVVDRDDAIVVDPGLDGRHHVLVLRDDAVSEVRVYPDRSSAVAAIEERPW